MKRTLAIALLSILAAAAQGGEPTPATDSTLKPARTQQLVDAARDARARRKKSSTKVITNADVKKSKGKLIVIDRPEPRPGTNDTPELTLEEMEARRRARSMAEERLTAAEKEVAALSKEVDRLEQQYYEENDPNYRDQVIQDRFTEAKGRLDQARVELDGARAAVEGFREPNP